MFNVFAEDVDGLINDTQPLAKRRRRASFVPRRYALSKPPTPLVIDFSHGVGPCADLNWEEEPLDGHDWQARRIVGWQQTPSGLEYDVSTAKTLWLPRTTFNTKLVQRYNAEQRAATTARTR